MKLRIQGNSIRLRLTRPEVAVIAAEGTLASRTDLGESEFKFTLRSDPKNNAISARCVGGNVEIIVPQKSLQYWATSEEVGLYGEQPTNGESLKIAVEKDFKCLDRSRASEDEKDAYPHPALKRKTS